jgi:hypothetical protein
VRTLSLASLAHVEQSIAPEYNMEDLPLDPPLSIAIEQDEEIFESGTFQINKANTQMASILGGIEVVWEIH